MISAIQTPIPTCAPDRISHGDNLLQVSAFILRRTLFLWLLTLALPLWEPTAPLGIWVTAGLFFVTTSHVSRLTQAARRCLPLGNRRASLLLWWWRVPITPLSFLLASGLRALKHQAPPFLDSAQHALWAAGVLALLSLIQNLLRTDRTLTRWIRSVLWISVASLFFLYHVPSPLTTALTSGKYDMPLAWIAAGLVALSFWGLRFSSHEELLIDLPATTHAAARQWHQNGGWGTRFLSGLDGAIPATRISRHWLLQLLARCLFSYQSLIAFALMFFLRYLFGKPAGERDSAGDSVLPLMAALGALPMVDIRVLRRLPVSVFTITIVRVGIRCCFLSLLLLPEVVFRRISGHFEVEFLFSNLISVQTLARLWVKAPLILFILVCQTLGMCFCGQSALLGVSTIRGSWWVVALTAGLVMIADAMFADLGRAFGWQSDLIVGGLLLSISMALDYWMIRWGDRIYSLTGESREAGAV